METFYVVHEGLEAEKEGDETVSRDVSNRRSSSEVGFSEETSAQACQIVSGDAASKTASMATQAALDKTGPLDQKMMKVAKCPKSTKKSRRFMNLCKKRRCAALLNVRRLRKSFRLA